MRRIISRSIPFKEVLRDLANKLDTQFKQDCGEYSIKIPDKYGHGGITGINLNEKLWLLLYNCTFKEDLEIQFIENEVHPLKFMFCEKGSFLHGFRDLGDMYKIDEMENIIVASNQNKGHIVRFKSGVETKINNLEIDRLRFYFSMRHEIKK